MLSTRFIVTDLETTGLSPARNRITEVACVYLEHGKIVSEMQTLVNPEQFIPQEIQRMTGITNARVLSAPKGAEIFPLVRTWVNDGSVFVAHNATFDFNFLQAAFDRHGLGPLGQPKLCTARLARRLLPARGSWGLGHLAGYFGVKVRNRHTALGDARITATVLARLIEIAVEEQECTTVAELLRLQYRTVARERALPEAVLALEPIIAGLPATPGVYRMLDRRGMLLYVGKAKSLRERVGSYFRPGAEHPTKIREMVRRVRKIEIEETGSELGALLLESKLIREHQPKFNTLLKRLRRYHFVRIDSSNAFPTVDVAAEIAADGSEYFGPFAGRDAAELVIGTIQHLFKLRECVGELAPSSDTMPCFYHQIDRCAAPCATMQDSQSYATEVDRVRAFLSGSEDGIIDRLDSRMQQYAEQLQFEEAAELRDRISELRRIFTGRRRVADSINGNNVIITLPAPDPEKREIFMIRYGRLARQIIVGKRLPVTKLRPLIESVYTDGSVTPPRYEREEVSEIRILASYIHRYRDRGRFVYV
ncbi:MAG: DEDD exonuclease domain-containing protein, partial [bacterium]|nr:DEDD exonuclease domain-containing protein [Candidatus Kapabacteria bacterium]